MADCRHIGVSFLFSRLLHYRGKTMLYATSRTPACSGMGAGTLVLPWLDTWPLAVIDRITAEIFLAS